MRLIISIMLDGHPRFLNGRQIDGQQHFELGGAYTQASSTLATKSPSPATIGDFIIAVATVDEPLYRLGYT